MGIWLVRLICGGWNWGEKQAGGVLNETYYGLPFHRNTLYWHAHRRKRPQTSCNADNKDREN